MCFFLLVFVIFVATGMQAFYFLRHSFRASIANKVIRFYVNSAAYCQQIPSSMATIGKE